MVQFISDLEDESAEAAQTRARAQEFLSTIVAKARGKPSGVSRAWGISPYTLIQSEASAGTSRPKNDSVEHFVQSSERTLHHCDVSADRPVHPEGEKKGGAQPSTRKPGCHQHKSPVRDHPPRRSRVDQSTQERSRRRSRECERRGESSFDKYHHTGQQRRPSPRLFGRIHYPSPPKDLSQAHLHREFRSPEVSRKRKRRKKSKSSKSRPSTRSRSPNRSSSRSCRSSQREHSRDRVDYSDLLQPGPLPETFASGPATLARGPSTP